MNELWLTEWITDSLGMRFRVSQELTRFQSPYQEVAVYESPDFGRLLRLDGCNMTSVSDEHIYHEAMVQPGLRGHEGASSALILGGGDGGAARLILQSQNIRRVVIAELDACVVEVSKQYLPEVCAGVFDDPRVELVLGDAWVFLNNTREQFDLIVMDLTDPDPNLGGLYSNSAFELMQKRLSPRGFLSTHVGSACFHVQRCAAILGRLRNHFANVTTFERYVPIYGVPWTFAISTNSSV